MNKYLEKIAVYIFMFLLAYMPLYVFLSTWIGTSTGYLDAIKISKELLLFLGFFLALGTTPLVILKKLTQDKFVWLVAGYAGLTVLLALVKPTDQDAEIIAIVYNLRFLLFFLYAVLLVQRKDKDFYKKCIKIVLFSGTIVALFGIFQVALLPNNALSHVGYSRENGTPVAFFISDETQSIERAYSTVKDPNSLGSYLIIICSIAAFYLIQKWPKKRDLLGGILLAVSFCLLLTYSRSAWIGAVFAGFMLIVLASRTRNMIIKYNKQLAVGLGVAAVLFIGLLFVSRNTSIVQNLVFHVGDDAPVTSNSQRRYAIDYTLDKVLDNPLGYGPGTAGPASFKNDIQGAVIPENYYLQIAYEVGVFGLLLFLAICLVVFKRLLIISKNDNVSKALIASFVGIAITNLFVQIWFNEAVAYTWWGVAGLAVCQTKLLSEEKHTQTKSKKN